MKQKKNSRWTNGSKSSFEKHNVKIDVVLTERIDGTFISDFKIHPNNIVNNHDYWKIWTREGSDIRQIFFAGVYDCLGKINRKYYQIKDVQIYFYIQLNYITDENNKFLFANCDQYKDRLKQLHHAYHKTFYIYLKPNDKRSESKLD